MCMHKKKKVEEYVQLLKHLLTHWTSYLYVIQSSEVLENFISQSVYVCVCKCTYVCAVCANMYTHMCTHMFCPCIHMWKSEMDFQCLPLSLFTLSLRQGLSLSLVSLLQLGRLARRPLEFTSLHAPSPEPSAEISGVRLMPTFMLVLRI